MANFLEQPSRPFSPYVPKVDVGLYQQVGQYKQSQYDSGVSRIQNAIDNVAGLDIYKDVDKQYLQDKMSNLRTELNQLASDDFSNSSSVNRALGLAGNIYKDEKVVNAVTSTAQIKSLFSNIKNLKEKHPDKYSSANEWYDQQGVNAYMSDTSAGAKYHGGTEPTTYFDWQTPLNAQLKALEPSIQTNITPTGQFTYKVDKSSKVDPATIQSIVDGYIASTPQAQQQMSIDGLYTYKDYNSASSLMSHIHSSYDSQIKGREDLVASLTKQKELNPDNQSYQAEINSQITAIQSELKSIQARKGQYTQMLTSGAPLDAIKQTLYNDNVRNTMTLTYQKDNHDIDVKANDEAINTMKFMMEGQRLTLDKLKTNAELIKSGIDPETGNPITPGSKYYDAHNAANNSSDPFASLTRHYSGPNDRDAEYTMDENTRQIQTLAASMQQQEDQLFSEYQKKFPNGTTKSAFNNWKAQQELLITNNKYDQVDDDYKQYKAQTMIPGIQQQSRIELENAAKQYALSQSEGLHFDVDGVHIQNPNGSIGTKLVVDAGKGKQFLSVWDSFMKDYNRNLDSVQQDLASQGVTVNTANDKKGFVTVLRDRAARATLSMYQGNHYANILNGLGGAQFNSFKFLDKMDEINSKLQRTADFRKDKADEYMKQHGLTYNLPTTTITGKKEFVDQARVAISSSPSLAGDKLETSKIEPLSYRSDIDGGAWVTYRYDGGKPQEVKLDISTPLPGYDPYSQLEKSIQQSPKQMTPVEGPNVMISNNAKIKYAIGWNKMKNAYDLYLIGSHGYKKIPEASSPSVAPIIKVIESWSSLTADEIIDKKENPEKYK